MTTPTTSTHLVLDPHRREDRKVAIATLVGTTVEWYDFFIYSNAVALVFGPLFFEPLARDNTTLAQVIGFATVGISFFFRPLGALVAGHLGDKIGRKAMMVATLILMGAATLLIGLLPTYATIGVGAPVLLVALRVLQGFAAGGEWGGAALMAVEHAPAAKRGWFGGFPQVGVPLGMLTATAVLAIVHAVAQDGFATWGWRVPFLLSIVLIVVGMAIRLGVSESPIFEEVRKDDEQLRLPIVQLFRFSGKQVVLGALAFMGNGVAGYMVTGGYILAYASGSGGLGVNADHMLYLITLASAAWILTTLFAARISDKIGRVRTYQIGFALQLLWVFPLFLFVDRASMGWIACGLLPLTISLGLTYGPQSALFAEIFPARVRYSGAGMAYAIGAILGGAFAPMIATSLQASFHTSMAVSAYLFIFTAAGLAAVSLLKDRTGLPLGPEANDIPGNAELEQAVRSHTVAGTKATFEQGAGW
ncbi:MHS family MFS transporter [Nanchangia anserum]|uniref:MHS family MFS transporter n=1 Tax=Nanchangia anserum TaxID=2692125 RepID=A0A8I0GCV6_9ACTO|nr:MFS transporter [Nanchangia anserum]MBD3689223.1 MHS family MFS transporter [Nanchangia anserum]QOX81446.1 MHS family MFS transporter [Nanchangia anserum]